MKIIKTKKGDSFIVDDDVYEWAGKMPLNLMTKQLKSILENFLN